MPQQAGVFFSVRHFHPGLMFVSRLERTQVEPLWSDLGFAGEEKTWPKKCLEMTNALAYYTFISITIVKNSTEYALGGTCIFVKIFI